MIKDLAFLAYSVSDVPRAVAFYRDTLGMKPGELFGDHWAEFEAGSTTFGIGDGSSLGMAPGKSSGASFEVDDITAMRERLVDKGVVVGEIQDFPSCSAMFFNDPDGNIVALHQRKT